MTTPTSTIEDVLARLADVKREGREWRALCPIHGGHALTVTEKDGKVLAICRAGCDQKALAARLGLNGNGTKPEPVKPTTYDYVDEAGELLFQVVRRPGKKFAQRRPDGRGGWAWSLGNVRRVLYNLPDVLDAARQGGTVYVVEGEKDADAIGRAGEVGTCNPCGAGKWRKEYAQALRGAHVVVIPDRDEPGYDHAREVARSLEGVAASVRMVEAATGKDAYDHLAAGHALDDFVPLLYGDEAERAVAAWAADMMAEAVSVVATAATGDSPPKASGIIPGDVFIFDGPEHVCAAWGQGDEVLWASGETFAIVGPQGVGKSSLAQQVVLSRIGVRGPALLDLPVAVSEGKVLYVAADRPTQIKRSLRRMVVEAEHRELLHDRLVIHQGPLPFDLASEPDRLREYVAEKGEGATCVVIDSLKDVASKLSSDEAGASINRAFQSLLVAGVDILVVHHQRKGEHGSKPKSLSDVYGSTLITSGMGSIVVLWGDAGDPIVELTHLKQPLEEIGPFNVRHDHETGTTTRVEGVDLFDLIRGSAGLTTREAAEAFYGDTYLTDAQVEKVRRKLAKWEREGKVVRRGEAKPRAGRGGEGAKWYVVEHTLDLMDA